ncbi:MAG: DUF3786 domain-containing protein [Candidatus Limivivens sp.]|nr:DUF3786 domain-containing protein [Candidatus Limivivens sp.]
MSFHSYRNIGFSFTDAEAACRKWRERFSGFDSAGKERYITFTREKEYLRLWYFGQEYRLNCGNGVLEKKEGTEWTDRLEMNEALTVYHYLGDGTGNVHESGEWVPESSLDPVRIRSSDRMDPLLVNFAKDYSGKTEELEKRCKIAGGEYEKSAGDTAWIFFPFPEIPLKLVFWEKDEEFPAQVKVYARENATDYVHYEAVSFMIADLFQKIDAVDFRTASLPEKGSERE